MTGTKQTFSYCDEESLGNLYLQGKIKGETKSQENYSLNLVASSIRREYYSNPNRRPLIAFRKALEKGNKVIKNLNTKGSFICGLMYQGRLYLSQSKDGKFQKINQSKVSSISSQKNYQQEPFSNLPIIRPQIPAKKRLIPKIYKAFTAGYLIFVLLLIGSSSGKAAPSEQGPATPQSPYSQSQLKIKQAQAILVFNEHKKARQLLQQASNLLPKITKKDQRQDIKQKINKISQKAQQIQQAQAQAHLTFSPETSEIIKVRDSVYGLNPDKEILYSTSLSSQKSPKELIQKKSLNWQSMTLLEKEDNIIIVGQQSLSLFNHHQEKFEKLEDIQMPNKPVLAQSTYRQYLYLATQSQIYKYPRSLIGFSKPKKWLKQDLNLEQVISMSIDGHIYILKKNGQVLRLFRGRQDKFALKSLDQLKQPLKNPRQIFTTPENNYLYILEKKRLLSFNKKGELKQQYKNPEFANLQDLWVNKDDTKAWLLNNNKLLEINLL